jgi:hypothetical protein
LHIPFESESAGTRHVVHAFPALNFALKTAGLAIMESYGREWVTG